MKIVLLLVLFVLLPHPLHSLNNITWRPWKSFNMTTPTGVYPLTLSEDSRVQVNVTYSGKPDNIRIYFFNSNNLLIPYYNQVSDYSSKVSGRFSQGAWYFVVYQQISDMTEAYQIYNMTASVNGNLVYSDVNLRSSIDVSYLELDLPTSCAFKVVSSNSSHLLELFQKSDGKSLDKGFKSVEGVTVRSGLSYVKILHKLDYTSALNKQLLTILTDEANPCSDFCDSVQDSLRLVYGTKNECLCRKGFVWNDAQKSCVINCAHFGAVNVGNSRNTCGCQVGYVWSTSLNLCQKDCGTSAVTYSSGSLALGSRDACGCQVGFLWSSSLLQCVRDCRTSVVVRSSGSLAEGSINSCKCQAGSIWNSLQSQCQINCQPGFLWSPSSSQCLRDCSTSTISYSSGSLASGSTDTCKCQEGYIWNPTLSLCLFCHITEQITHGLVPSTCKEGFIWNSLQSQCVRDCSRQRIPNSSGFLQSGSTDLCKCVNGFIWFSSSSSCLKRCDNTIDMLSLDFFTRNSMTLPSLQYQWFQNNQ